MNSENEPSGILLIDKPKGMTSHDVVSSLRRVLKTKRIGHAGTLDPDATGLLVVCVGKATKSSAQLSGVDKEYRASFRLGVETDTFDSSGKVLRTFEVHTTREELEKTLKEFEGEQQQQAPIYSAIKVNGRKLYEYARKGIEVTPPTRNIFIKSLKLLSFEGAEGELEVACSKGTYVRSLVHDIGKRLGVGGITTDIRRTRCGESKISDAISLDALLGESDPRTRFQTAPHA